MGHPSRRKMNVFKAKGWPPAHYTPTYSSWLNQIERWFGLITQRAIRRGSFRSVKELVAEIDAVVQHYNRSSRPFVWTATADSILQKIARHCLRSLRISGDSTLEPARPVHIRHHGRCLAGV